ncbi:MAG: hypothetical protein IJS39_03695 [Synergistaceae bacterium]|nr:hypothetical protein [Synergistaceae bacterium]
MFRKVPACAVACIVLLIIMSSCAYAEVLLQFHKADSYYVGEDATAAVTAISGGKTNVFTVASGTLPPGCYLEQSGGSSANIKGKPTAAGIYSFTVNVKSSIIGTNGHGGMTTTYDYGSVECVMSVNPARSGINTNINTDIGNTTGQTTNNQNTGSTVGSSSGGGGCNTGITLLGLLAAALIFRKSA